VSENRRRFASRTTKVEKAAEKKTESYVSPRHLEDNEDKGKVERRRRDMWAQLPELILTQVFGHLGGIDRVNAGQVCRHWARCLGSPSLWRRCTVHIDRDLSIDCSIASELAVGLLFPSLWLRSPRPSLVKLFIITPMGREVRSLICLLLLHRNRRNHIYINYTTGLLITCTLLSFCIRNKYCN
jgi:hypothetical protein